MHVTGQPYAPQMALQAREFKSFANRPPPFSFSNWASGASSQGQAR